MKKINLEEQLNRVFNLSKEIRGSFLDQAIPIEMLIDDIISHHFCPEEARRIFFFSITTPEISFSNKIKILETILKNSYPDLIEKHSELFREIRKVKDFRNRIAHSILDTTDAFLKKKYGDRIRLEFYKKGEKKHLVIKLDDMRRRLVACSNVVLSLKHIQEEVIRRVHE